MTTNTIAKAWGAEIKRTRTNRPFNMSRAELAEHLDVSRQTVRLWEEGIHAPSSHMQGVLIRRLGLDPMRVAKLMGMAGDAA